MANQSPEERAQNKFQGDILHFLLQLEPSTDIASALKSTILAEEATPHQLEANVKLLKSLQKQLK